MGDDLLNATDLTSRLQQQAHVWLCRNDTPLSSQQRGKALSLLSDAERERYHRFHFDADRHAYLLSHGLVRNTLSRYADVAPDAWCFSDNAHGKPAIAGKAANTGLQFNLSHTKGMSACVVTQARACGVDIENIHRHNRLSAIAARMFAEAERVTLQGLHESAMRERFFRYWTLREAYVKALGTGLSGSSRSFYFVLEADECGDCQAQLHHTTGEDGAGWQLMSWWQGDSHMAAVAIEAVGKTPLEIVKQTITL